MLRRRRVGVCRFVDIPGRRRKTATDYNNSVLARERHQTVRRSTMSDMQPRATTPRNANAFFEAARAFRRQATSGLRASPITGDQERKKAAEVQLWQSVTNADGDAIHEAIRGGDTQLVHHLLQRGAPVGALHESGLAPIHLAAKLDHEQIVSLLLRHGAGKDALDRKGRTPLHLTCIYGCLKTAHVLLDAGANVDIVVQISSDGLSGYEHWAMGFAARMGHVDVVNALVLHGANVNATSTRGLTALHYAAVRNQAGTIDALIEAGADIEATVDANGGGGTALHASAVMRCHEAALALLKHGANVEAKNAFGFSPLHGAAHQAGKEGAVKMVDLLLRWGADETTVDQDGKKPLDLASNNNSRVEEGVRRQSEVELLCKLLENAPVDRAWRRRGSMVLCRAFPDRLRLSADVREADPRKMRDSSYSSEGCELAGSARATAAVLDHEDNVGIFGKGGLGEATDWRGVATRLFELPEVGLFRDVVSFL